jgi:signal peptidase I
MKLKHVALGLLAAVLLSVAATAVWGWHEGYRAYVVRTGSMVPTFQPGDAVLDRTTSSGYAVGDPVTVALGPDVLVTHRLHAVDKHGLLHTKGDANPKPDAWALPRDRVRGVVTRVLPHMGFALVFLQQKTGVAGVMTSALALVLLWGICFPAETEAAPAAARQAQPDRRRILVRIPRQRTAAQALVASSPACRMPPTPPPVRRMPPTPPPLTTVVTPVATRVVPRPRTSADA